MSKLNQALIFNALILNNTIETNVNNDISKKEVSMKFRNNQLDALLDEYMRISSNVVDLTQTVLIETTVVDDDLEIAVCDGEEEVELGERMISIEGITQECIFDVCTSKTIYERDDSVCRTYTEKDAKGREYTVTVLPTFKPVKEETIYLVNTPTSDKSNGEWTFNEAGLKHVQSREEYEAKKASYHVENVELPSVEDIVALEEYYRKRTPKAKEYPVIPVKVSIDGEINVELVHCLAAENPFIRARLYSAFTNKNGILCRKGMELDDIWMSIEDKSKADIINCIQGHLSDMGLQFSKKMHVVLSGGGVYKLTEERSNYNDEWSSKLHVFCEDNNIYVQAPLDNDNNDNLIDILEELFNSGIQTGRQFDMINKDVDGNFCRTTTGLWEDYFSITLEVEDRTRLEAERYAVTNKMKTERKKSEVADKKGSYERITAVLNKLPAQDDRGKARLLYSGAVAINVDDIKGAIAYSAKGQAPKFPKTIYAALMTLAERAQEKEAA